MIPPPAPLVGLTGMGTHADVRDGTKIARNHVEEALRLATGKPAQVVG